MFECLQRGDAVRDHRKRKRKRKRKEVEEKPVRFCSDSDNHFISLRGSTVSLLLIQTRKHQKKTKTFRKIIRHQQLTGRHLKEIGRAHV